MHVEARSEVGGCEGGKRKVGSKFRDSVVCGV